MIGRIEALGAEAVRWNTERFPTTSKMAFDAEEMAEFVTDSGRALSLGEPVGVYVRRPEQPKYEGDPMLPELVQFARAESAAALADLMSLIRASPSRWIGDPLVTRPAENKVTQLRVASAVGMSVPKTLATNDEARAREFFAGVDGRTVAKTIRSPLIDRQGGRLAYTHVVSETDLRLLGDLQLAPVIFQELVPKRYEVRVTYVGTTAIPVAIYSQDHPGATDDWRKVPYPELRHELVELPEPIDRDCLEYLKRFGLNFGAFDFIVTSDDRWVFLECNPNGEWAWMEEVSGYPIGQRVAELLVAGS